MGLRDTIENIALEARILNVTDYIFREVDLKTLMKLVSGHTIVASALWKGNLEKAELTDANNAQREWNLYWGFGNPHVQEAFIMSDGLVVATISCTVFTDTFHSNETKTRLFIATRKVTT